MIRLKHNGVRWETQDGFTSTLERILADSGVAIKDTPTKLVTMHQVDSATFYVKRYLNDRVALRPLKYFFKRSEARREWALAKVIAARGIPVVNHLAVGERWGVTGLRESILITAGFHGVRLDCYPMRESDELQAALGVHLRLMHDRGILQEDLNHNILVQDRPLELCRIDVDRSEVRDSLNVDQRINNLAYLNVFVKLQPAFFKAYGADQMFVAELHRLSEIMRRDVACRNSRRSVTHNLRFVPLKINRTQWWVRRECFDEKLQLLLQHPDDPTEKYRPDLQIQTFHVRSTVERLQTCFAPSVARRTYRTLYHLELLHHPVPRPVAAGEQRTWRLLSRCYLITERIVAAVEVSAILQAGDRVDRELFQEVGAMIGRLHADGFSYRQLTASNILVNAQNQPYFDGLEYAEFLGETPASRAAADLETLASSVNGRALSRANRIAFLKAYRKAGGCGLLREIAKRPHDVD